MDAIAPFRAQQLEAVALPLLTYSQACAEILEYRAASSRWRAGFLAECRARSARPTSDYLPDSPAKIAAAERLERARAAVLGLDLRALTSEERREALLVAVPEYLLRSTSNPMASGRGIVAEIRPHWESEDCSVGWAGGCSGGEVLSAGVEDVELFEEEFGAPVTHARALQLASDGEIDGEFSTAAEQWASEHGPESDDFGGY